MSKLNDVFNGRDFVDICREIVEKNIAEANGRAGYGVNGLSCRKLIKIIDQLRIQKKHTSRCFWFSIILNIIFTLILLLGC